MSENVLGHDIKRTDIIREAVLTASAENATARTGVKGHVQSEKSIVSNRYQDITIGIMIIDMASLRSMYVPEINTGDIDELSL